MSEHYEYRGFDGTDWDIIFDLPASDRLVFFGPLFGNSIEVGAFQKSNHRTDSGVGSDLCLPNHVRNCEYVGPSQVDIGNGAVDLTPSNISLNDCTLRVTFQNDEASPTACETSSTFFYAYDGVDQANPPEGAKVVAFERTSGGTIEKASASGPGRAWNSAYGVGGYDNRLLLEDQGSASTHYFFIGLSLSPSEANPEGAGMFRFQTNYV